MKVSRTAITPYTPGEMYALVADVLAYPSFLPWCRSTQVLTQGEDEVRATIELAYRGVERLFTTHNRMQRNIGIEMRLVEGPFQCLEGYWRFDPLGDQGCKVSLTLEYEFSNWLLSIAIGPVFNPIINNLVDAFHTRALAVYGRRSITPP
ncbi:ribosome association toxin RatA [Gammaproteobacteria bacterium]